MPLTDAKIRAAKWVPGQSVTKLSEDGLQLWLTADGGKRWRLAYRFAGKQKSLAIGTYPEIGLKAAREARDEAKRSLAAGLDPLMAKRLAKVAKGVTFDLIAGELLEKKRREAKAQNTLSKMEWLLRLAKPYIGARPIGEITAPEILVVLQREEKREHLETAKRLRAAIGQVFRYAIATGRAEFDPTVPLRGAIATPVAKPRAAITDKNGFLALLRTIADYNGAPETRAAMELLALTFVRPGELRSARWEDIDLEGAVWSIPASIMKMRQPHKVPLAPRAIEVLRQMKTITGDGKFLFPSAWSRDRCMSENTITAALRRLGYSKEQMCAHGFRSAASSLLNESGKWNADAIERQLAHTDGNSVRRAYQRAEFWDERVKMMDWWARFCAGADVATAEN